MRGKLPARLHTVTELILSGERIKPCHLVSRKVHVAALGNGLMYLYSQPYGHVRHSFKYLVT